MHFQVERKRADKSIVNVNTCNDTHASILVLPVTPALMCYTTSHVGMVLVIGHNLGGYSDPPVQSIPLVHCCVVGADWGPDWTRDWTCRWAPAERLSPLCKRCNSLKHGLPSQPFRGPSWGPAAALHGDGCCFHFSHAVCLPFRHEVKVQSCSACRLNVSMLDSISLTQLIDACYCFYLNSSITGRRVVFSESVLKARLSWLLSTSATACAFSVYPGGKLPQPPWTSLPLEKVTQPNDIHRLLLPGIHPYI